MQRYLLGENNINLQNQPYILKSNNNVKQNTGLNCNESIVDDADFAKQLQIQFLQDDLSISKDDAEQFLNSVKDTHYDAQDFIDRARLLSKTPRPSAPPTNLYNSVNQEIISQYTPRPSAPPINLINSVNQEFIRPNTPRPSAPPIENNHSFFI